MAGNSGETDKLKVGVLGALLPIVLTELLVKKGIVTEDELKMAMAETVRKVAARQKDAK